MDQKECDALQVRIDKYKKLSEEKWECEACADELAQRVYEVKLTVGISSYFVSNRLNGEKLVEELQAVFRKEAARLGTEIESL